MLDSWVRYEAQVKQRQQKELAETIIGRIMKELENPKTLQQILNQSVADVESKTLVDLDTTTANRHSRDCFIKGAIDSLLLYKFIILFPLPLYSQSLNFVIDVMIKVTVSAVGSETTKDSVWQQPSVPSSSILTVLTVGLCFARPNQPQTLPIHRIHAQI